MTTTTSERFVAEIVQLHERLNWRGLPDAIDGEPLVRLEGFGDGLTTVCVHQSQIPDRYLKGIFGFRLAQFLQLGWMDAELAAARTLFHEPFAPSSGVDTVHAITLDDAGRLVGYISMVGSADPAPLTLDDPTRALFPAEVAHHVDLCGQFTAPGITTHDVSEIKRFVRRKGMARGLQRDRVPWHLILAIGRRNQTVARPFRLVLGDSTESGALRHLRLVGFDLVVMEDTHPNVAKSELMWPSYEKADLAKPWIGPVHEDLVDYMDAIESGLTADVTGDWQGTAARRIMSLLQRKAEVAGVTETQRRAS